MALLISGCASQKTFESQSLYQDIIRGDTEAAVRRIDSGSCDREIDTPINGVTALYLASGKNYTNVVQALLNHGANVNKAVFSAAQNLETPVYAAARTRSAESLRLLLAHGGQATRDRYNSSPFEASFEKIEYPDQVTDMLIEAGARPRLEPRGNAGNQFDAAGGTRWAIASYYERHGDPNSAIPLYQQAADWYQKAAEKALGREKFLTFMNSPFMRSTLVLGAVATSAAASANGGLVVYNDPLATLDSQKVDAIQANISTLANKAERFAAYSKLCSDRARELSAR